jgi:hypothetical protein
MRTSTNHGLRSLQWLAVLAANTLACASASDDSESLDDEFGSGISTGSPNGDTTSDTDGDTDGDTTSDTTDVGTDTTGTADTTDSGTDTAGTSDGSNDAESGSESESSSTGNEPIPCDIAEAALTPVIPHVVLVLDKSGSMITNTWDHDADPQTPQVTRWKSLHAVVSQLVNDFDDLFEFGAQLYPSKSATNEYSIAACLVETPPEVLIAPNNAVPILLEVPTANSTNVRGGTPASSGMSSAIDHLVDTDDGNPMAIILVTDGAANCRTDAADDFERFESYDTNLATIVGDAYVDLGIPTYVVGIDISETTTQITGVNNHPPDGEPDGINTFSKLDEVAVAGGKPLGGMSDFYATENELELQTALQAIVDDTISCTVLLDPIPSFPELVQVVIDAADVPQVMDCANEDGWVYTNPNGPYDSIELCGSWCVASQDAMDVKAEYFCDPG